MQKHDHCDVKRSKENGKIPKYTLDKKSTKKTFILYIHTEPLLEKILTYKNLPENFPQQK